MKVFIGGARQIRTLNKAVIEKLNNITSKNYEILIGDASGIDARVQQYYHDNAYRNVVIYASNGKARHNIGNWMVKNIPVPQGVTGFDYYATKDFEMAQDADYGFMIWNGKSRGTWNNVINLSNQNKTVVVYVSGEKKFYKISNSREAAELKAYLDHIVDPTLVVQPEIVDSQLHLF